MRGREPGPRTGRSAQGSAGHLYGCNTTGGAVNYIANKPSDSFESGIRLNVARFETTDVEAFLSGPLGEAWGARLALRDIRSQQGWQRSDTRPDDRAGRLILDGRPADTLGVAFTISGWRDGGEPQAPQAVGFRAQNQILGGMYELLGQSRDNALESSVRSQPQVPRKGENPRTADWTPELEFEVVLPSAGNALVDRAVFTGDQGAGITKTSDSYTRYVGQPRTFGLSVSWRFE